MVEIKENETGYSLNYYKDNEGNSGNPDYGKHIQISWDGSNFTPTNYYKHYWPILPLTPPNNTTIDYNTLSIKFRKEYNPEPLIYADYAKHLQNNKPERLKSSAKFKSEKNPSQTGWTDVFSFSVLNYSASTDNHTQVSSVVHLMNIRTKYPNTLPNTVPKKEHFLDNIFGPVGATPDFAGANTTQWITFPGKKWIDGGNKNGMIGVFEVGMGVSQTEVIYFATLVDEYVSSELLAQKEELPRPQAAGKSTKNSLIDATKNNWFTDRSFELQKQGMDNDTFYIMNQKPVNPPKKTSGQIMMVMSRTEHDNIALPAGIDATLTPATFQFENVTVKTDSNNNAYIETTLAIGGVDSAGTVMSSSTGQKQLTFNYNTLNTKSAGAQAQLKKAANGIIDIDTLIEDIKIVETTYSYDSLRQTCLRIRVHYYGNAWVGPIGLTEYAKGVIFDNTIPQLLNNTNGYLENKSPSYPNAKLKRKRQLYPGELNGNIQAWNRLTSHADENGVQDNPSPYLKDSDGNDVDLGQILYGFESIYYQHHRPVEDLLGPNKPDSSTYSPSYTNFPVKIVNDLAGWLANVITPAVEYFYQTKTGEEVHEGLNLVTLQDFYDYSAPEADLYGNADAVGIWHTLQLLLQYNNEDDLKLSDVFTLYYKGTDALRQGVTAPAGPPIYDQRWVIFSEFFGFLYSNGNYQPPNPWMPDHPTAWENIKEDYDASSNPTGRSYNTRFMGFAEFWYNRLIGPLHNKRLVWDLVFNIEFPDSTIILFENTGNFNNTNKTEIEFVKDKIQICFNTIFLDFIKSKIF